MSELHHNTVEQVERYLRAALDLIDKLEPPEDLRVAAFQSAVNMVASKTVTATALQPAGVERLLR
jgi:hypothetical protein